MKITNDDYKGIYLDMVEVLGKEITIKVYKHYKGQQVTFPMRMYSKSYVVKYLNENYDGTNLKSLSKELGYTERWVRKIIDTNSKQIKRWRN